jgi:competence transcription factor ComK
MKTFAKPCGYLAALVSLLAMQGPVKADTVLAFSQPDFEWSHAAEGWVKPYHIWLAGDYWAQDFLATGLLFANHLTLTLNIDDNTFSSQQLEVNVLLNQMTVGSLSLSPGMLGTQTYAFAFDPIPGPDYRLDLRASNTVTDTGCVSLAIDGSSFADVGYDTLLTFSQADFEWSHAAESWVMPYHIWLADDYWAQNFAATQLASANHMTLTLYINDNTFSNQQLGVNILLNETVVGNVSLTPGMVGIETYDFSFDPVPGPDYRLEIRAANTVTDTGCVSIAIDGRSFSKLDGPP